jgi:delta-aminolevulinic acid dehydratase/porphobilinogen synthase
MYPIFIVDEPDAEEDIPSLPLQKRYVSSAAQLTSEDGVSTKSSVFSVLSAKRVSNQ